MDLHQACQDQLNHYLTMALVCGAKVPKGHDKTLLQYFGLIHFLVISGAHVQFILYFFKWLENNILVQKTLNNYLYILTTIKLLSLILLNLSTAFTAPIMRVSSFMSTKYLLKKAGLIKPSRALCTTIVFILIFPIAKAKSQELSFILSLSFSLICSICYSKNTFKFALLIYILSLPLYLCLFSPPHILSILLNPLFSFLTAFFLLPLSFLSLFSNSLELIVINIWWSSLDFLSNITIFLNLTTNLESKSPKSLILFCYLYFFLLLFIETFGKPFWIRKSYSFS